VRALVLLGQGQVGVGNRARMRLRVLRPVHGQTRVGDLRVHASDSVSLECNDDYFGRVIPNDRYFYLLHN
jgi:hypothetical protein